MFRAIDRLVIGWRGISPGRDGRIMCSMVVCGVRGPDGGGFRDLACRRPQPRYCMAK